MPGGILNESALEKTAEVMTVEAPGMKLLVIV